MRDLGDNLLLTRLATRKRRRKGEGDEVYNCCRVLVIIGMYVLISQWRVLQPDVSENSAMDRVKVCRRAEDAGCMVHDAEYGVRADSRASGPAVV